MQKQEARTDWLMRQFVDDTLELVKAGMSLFEARTRMTERGVPKHVQWRVLS